MRPEQKLLWLFFYHPHREFGLRELAREAGLDPKTVQKSLRELCRRGLVVRKEERGRFPRYEANAATPLFRAEKSHALVRRILESGLIQHLEAELKPEAIVLFGSVQHGDYRLKSDIDLFIQGPQKHPYLGDFSRALGHTVSLIFAENPLEMSQGFLNAIYNGRTLAGNLRMPVGVDTSRTASQQEISDRHFARIRNAQPNSSASQSNASASSRKQA
jgi:predicted nucleotidyltransferase